LTVKELSTGITFHCLNDDDDSDRQDQSLIGTVQSAYLVIDCCELTVSSVAEHKLELTSPLENAPEDASELHFTGSYQSSEVIDNNTLYKILSSIPLYTEAELNDYQIPVALSEYVRGEGMAMIYFTS
jgi:hypothetical protein